MARALVHPRLTQTALADRFATAAVVEQRVDTYNLSGEPVTTWTPYPRLDPVMVQLYYPEQQSTQVVEMVGAERRVTKPEARLPYHAEIVQGDRFRLVETGATWLVEAARHDSQQAMSQLTLEDVDIAAQGEAF